MTLSRPLPPNIYWVHLPGFLGPANPHPTSIGGREKGIRERAHAFFTPFQRVDGEEASHDWKPPSLSVFTLSPLPSSLPFMNWERVAPTILPPWFYFDAHVVVFRETPLVTFLDFFFVNFFYNIGLKKAKSKLVICIYDQKKMIFSHRWTFFWYIRIFSQILVTFWWYS